MQTKITLLALLLSPMFSIGQISILSSDIPIPTTVHVSSITPSVAPSLGNNQVWDYSSYMTTSPSTIDYVTETDPLFTAVGVDVYTEQFKNLTNSLGYYVYNEIDFNTSAVEEKGFYLDRQPYSISSFTGNTSDSIVFSEQGKLLSNPRTFLKFPLTVNTSWSSTTRRAIDFNLTVTSSSLFNTPGQHIYNVMRKDSIIGWGTLRVYTASGPSAAYEVLMNKLEQYSVDSFYLGGAPAPTPLLTAFGVTQGQIMNQQYAYQFYRKGSYNYLMRLFYGADNTFTTLASAFIHTDNIAPTSIKNANDNKYQTILYPNPCQGGLLNILVIGKTISDPIVSIIDMTGKLIQSKKTNFQANGTIKLDLGYGLRNGNYALQIMNEKHEIVVNEIITIQ